METITTEKNVKKQYNRTASLYDSLYPRYLSVTINKISKLIEGKNIQNALDIGSGTGELLLRISQKFPNAQFLIGIDLSKAMLEKAEQKLRNHPNIKLHLMSAETTPYPYPSNYFDIIVSSGAVHYMNNFQSVLEEIKRILTSDGSCIVVDMASNFFSTRFIRFFKMDPSAVRFYSLESMEGLIKNNGFKIIFSELFRAGIFGLYLIEFKKIT